MPFLWKKVKSTRISRLVNDHLQNSQKRRDGSSLVVETGFPTSLIDLFIKNREKLTTPSKKKRRDPPICDADDQLVAGSPPASPPPPPPPSIAGSLTSPPHSPLRCPSPLHNLSVLPSPSRCVGETSAAGSCGGDERVVAANVNNVLFGVLKIFLVVVLALGTKRLVVGVTISAFLLLFIEYVGRHVGVVSRLLRFKEIKLDEREKDEVFKIEPLDDEIQEIEESMCKEIQPVIGVTDEPSLGFQESEASEKQVKKKSRKSKIKSRMTKYVTKKFTRKKNEPQRPDEQVDQCSNDGESVSSSSLSSSSSSWRMYRDEVGARESRFSEVIEEANTKKAEAGLTWRHLALCLIVLIGLLGGRVFALVLTLSCLLLLKLGQKLPRFININLVKLFNF